MSIEAWLQLFLTVLSMIVAMLVFYFKSEQVLRKEILASEERIRVDVKEIRQDVTGLSERVAVMEAIDEREEKIRGRLPTNPGRY